MQFCATESDMNGFPYDGGQPKSSSPEFSYREKMLYSQPQYTFDPLLVNQVPESYFTLPSEDTGWMDDAPGPPSHPSHSSLVSSHCHVDLASITEHEIWNIPPLSRRGSHFSNRDTSSPSSPTSSSSALANTDSGNPNDFFIHSTPSDDQSPRKRRRSSTGLHEDVVPAMDREAETKDEGEKSKAKPSAKVSHSVVERKYRENLNTKITQLDQALTLIRQAGDETCEAPGKARKADVITDALRYVKQANLDGEARVKEIDFLRLRVAALEKLVHCGDCALLKQFAGQQMDHSTNF